MRIYAIASLLLCSRAVPGSCFVKIELREKSQSISPPLLVSIPLRIERNNQLFLPCLPCPLVFLVLLHFELWKVG